MATKIRSIQAFDVQYGPEMKPVGCKMGLRDDNGVRHVDDPVDPFDPDTYDNSELKGAYREALWPEMRRGPRVRRR